MGTLREGRIYRMTAVVVCVLCLVGTGGEKAEELRLLMLYEGCLAGQYLKSGRAWPLALLLVRKGWIYLRTTSTRYPGYERYSL